MLPYDTNFNAEKRKLSDIYNKSNLSFQTFLRSLDPNKFEGILVKYYQSKSPSENSRTAIGQRVSACDALSICPYTTLPASCSTCMSVISKTG